MRILSILRQSISGTSIFFQKSIKNFWSFFALHFITFGIVQAIVIFLFFIIYANVTSTHESSLLGGGELENIASSGLVQYASYIGLYPLLFLVAMLYKARGTKASDLAFGNLFQQIPARTYLVYLVAVGLTLAGYAYIIDSIDYAYGNATFNLLDEMVYTLDEKWYVALLKEVFVYLLEFAPAFVIGYFLVYLKQGRWDWSFIRAYWKPGLVILILIASIQGLFETISKIFSDIFFKTLLQTLENPTIIVLLSLIVSITLAIILNAVLGVTIYFAVFSGEDEAEEAQLGSDSELLDQ